MNSLVVRSTGLVFLFPIGSLLVPVDQAEFSNMLTSLSTDMEIMGRFVFLFTYRVSFRVLDVGNVYNDGSPAVCQAFWVEKMDCGK